MDKQEKTLSIGLVGCGGRLRWVTRKLIADRPQIRVAKLFDPDPDAVRTAREEMDAAIPAAASLEDLIRDPEIAWVFIGSYNRDHAAQAVAALNAGKHVFCEKPLALRLEECLAVREAARRNNRTFAFGLVLRYAPIYRKIHSLVAEGRIGRIVSFEFNETLGYNHGGYIFGNWRRRTEVAGSYLLEKCCHDLDLANWLTGSLPVRVAGFSGRDIFRPENAALATRIPADSHGRPAYRGWPDPHGVDPFSPGADIADNQVAVLEYASGVRGTFHTNAHAGIQERRFYLLGTEGTIRADAITGVIELRRIGPDEPVVRHEIGHGGGHAGGDEVMARHLAASLLEGAAPLASVEEGIRSCIAAFGIDQATDEGRVVNLRPMWKQAGIDPAA